MVEDIDPLEILKTIKNTIKQSDPQSAASLCRVCLETSMRRIASSSFPERYNTREKWNLKDLNLLLREGGIYSWYWFYTIKNIVTNFGVPAIHTLRKITEDEARLFYTQVKAFIESILFPLENRPQLEIVKSKYPMFHFIIESKELQSFLNLPNKIDDVLVDHFLLSAILDEITPKESFNILLKGEPGVGKTTLLFQIGKTLLENKNIIIAIPYYGIDPEEMYKIHKEYENIVFILNDLDFFDKQGNFLNQFRNYHQRIKNLITTCRLHEYISLTSKHDYLEGYFQYKYLIVKGNEEFLLDVLEKYLDNFSIRIQEQEASDIKNMLLSKSEGLILYLVEVINDFIRKRDNNNILFSLNYVQELPEGIIAFVCDLFYRTFINIDQDKQQNRLVEFKILYLLSNLFNRKYHVFFLENLVIEISSRTTQSHSSAIVNIHPQDYLVKTDLYHYQFSHSIWSWILVEGNEIITPIKENFSQEFRRILDIVESTIEAFKEEFRDRWIILLKALGRALESPPPDLPQLPIQLWINAIENFPIFYRDKLLPFFEYLIKEEEKCQILIKNDCKESRFDIYIKFLELIRLYGRNNRDFGYYEEALTSFDIGLRISEIIEANRLRIDFFIAKAITYRFMQDYEETFKYQEKALQLSKDFDFKERIADCSYNLAITHFECKHIEKVDSLIPQIESIYTELKDKSGLASVSVLKGQLSRMKGDKIDERSFFKKAIRLAEESNNAKMKLNALIHLGTTYMVKPSDFEKGKQFLEEAKELAIKNIDPREYTKILMNLSTIYMNLGDFEKSEEETKSSLSIAQGLKDKETEAMAFSQLGSIYFRKRKYKEALEVLVKSEIISKELNLENDLVLIYRTKGRIYLASKDLDKAKSEFKKSLSHIHPLLDLDESDDTFIWFSQYGDLLAASNEIEKALEIYQLAEEQWERLSDYHHDNPILEKMKFGISLNKNSFELKKAIDTDNRMKVELIGQKYKSLVKILQDLPDERQNEPEILIILTKSIINYTNVLTVLFQMTEEKNYIKAALKELDEVIKILTKKSSIIPDAEIQLDECYRIQRVIFDLALKN